MGRRTARAADRADLPVPVVYAFAQVDRPGRLLGLCRTTPGGARMAIEHLLRSAGGGSPTSPARGPGVGPVARRGRARGAGRLRPRFRRAPGCASASGASLGPGRSASCWTGRRCRRGLLRQRPDRARRGRRAARPRAAPCRTTSPSSASTTGSDRAGRRPPLTTIDMNLHDLGREAADLLLDAIDGQPARTRPPPATLPARRARVDRRPGRPHGGWARRAGRRGHGGVGPRAGGAGRARGVGPKGRGRGGTGVGPGQGGGKGTGGGPEGQGGGKGTGWAEGQGGGKGTGGGPEGQGGMGVASPTG